MLTVGDVKNFRTLCRAFHESEVALMEVKRVSDQKVVAAICTVEWTANECQIIPFAVMVEGNPFELFCPPKPGGGFHEEEDDEL